jgi:hypothetical protein
MREDLMREHHESVEREDLQGAYVKEIEDLDSLIRDT